MRFWDWMGGVSGKTDPAAAAWAAWCSKGFAAWRGMAGGEGDGAGEVPSFGDFAAGLVGLTPVGASGTDPASALAQAWRISAVSALRYGQALMAVQARYQADLVQVMTDQAVSADDRLLSDMMRGYLREVGEAAGCEARRFEMELERLGEAVARATAEAGPPAEPRADGERRRYRVKR